MVLEHHQHGAVLLRSLVCVMLLAAAFCSAGFKVYCRDCPQPAVFTHRIGWGRVPGRAAPGPPSAPRPTFAPPRSASHPPRHLHSSACSLSLPDLTALSPEQHAAILGFRSSSNTPRLGTAATDTRTRTFGSGSGSGGSAGTSSAEVTTASSGGRGASRTASSGGGERCSTAAVASHRALASTNSGRAWSFGPPDPAQGMQRRRYALMAATTTCCIIAAAKAVLALGEKQPLMRHYLSSWLPPPVPVIGKQLSSSL